MIFKKGFYKKEQQQQRVTLTVEIECVLQNLLTKL
jgi:hypothetical protein